jgi:putative phosphoribosyl transferase
MMTTHSKKYTLSDSLARDDRDQHIAGRAAAGRQLAEQLQHYRGSRAIVLALPPGGVAVAIELARALRLPLDVLVARELRVRECPSVLVGAFSEGGGLCFNRAALRLPAISLQAAWRAACEARDEIAPLIERYRDGRPLPVFNRRPVILVDDGLGAGLMQLAVLQALRHYHPQRCIVASPGGSSATVEQVARCADALVVLSSEANTRTNDNWRWRYPLGDDDAIELMASWRLPYRSEHSREAPLVDTL